MSTDRPTENRFHLINGEVLMKSSLMSYSRVNSGVIESFCATRQMRGPATLRERIMRERIKGRHAFRLRGKNNSVGLRTDPK
jgi:hypothetical protein